MGYGRSQGVATACQSDGQGKSEKGRVLCFREQPSGFVRHFPDIRPFGAQLQVDDETSVAQDAFRGLCLRKVAPDIC